MKHAYHRSSWLGGSRATASVNAFARPLWFLYPRWYQQAAKASTTKLGPKDAQIIQTSDQELRRNRTNRPRGGDAAGALGKDRQKHATSARLSRMRLQPIENVDVRRVLSKNPQSSGPAASSHSGDGNRMPQEANLGEGRNSRAPPLLPYAERRERGVARRILASCRRRVKTDSEWSFDLRIPVRILDKHTPKLTGEKNENDVRRVTSAIETRKYPMRRADQIPRPQKWTKRSLAFYVHELCHASIPRVVRRRIYERHEQHDTLVTKILLSLFSDLAVRPALTTAAFNMVLLYLEKHNKVSTVRRLFMDMERLGVAMDIESFNIMLRATAAARDLHNFTFILQLAVRRGHALTGQTWVALLMMIDSTWIKMQILERMRARGLLRNLSTRKDALAQVVSGALSGWLNQGGDPAGFVAFMDRTWGPAWLSTSAANRIFNELGGRGLSAACLTLCEHILPARHIPVDCVSINTLLGHFGWHDHDDDQQQQQLLVPVLRVIELAERRHIPLDEVSYDILWSLARRHQLHHVASLVWRYACAHTAVSPRLEYRVGKSLSRNTTTTLLHELHPSLTARASQSARPNHLPPLSTLLRPALLQDEIHKRKLSGGSTGSGGRALAAAATAAAGHDGGGRSAGAGAGVHAGKGEGDAGGEGGGEGRGSGLGSK